MSPRTGVLHHVFRSFPFRHEDYHLVDLGSGKGRTLPVGSEYPFKAITGVDYFQRVQQHRPIPRNWTWSLWQHV